MAESSRKTLPKVSLVVCKSINNELSLLEAFQHNIP